MTDDPMDELDQLLRTAARDYNRPSAVPRDQMWERIRAERERAQRSAPPVLVLSRRRWLVAAVAAAAMLVVGIGLGRLYERYPSETQAARMAAVTPPATVDPAKNPSLASTPIDTAPDAGSVQSPRNVLAGGAVRPSTSTRQPRPAGPGGPGVGGRAADGASMAYRLAVVEHLAGAEALLTSFRVSSKRGEVDPDIARWARSLLTTTRLLESSAAQQDPTMRRLLGDLELVLLQIAQYTAGARNTGELELIEHSIERRGVIAKIRTTIPARLTPAGT
jgi:hypothetical protein